MRSLHSIQFFSALCAVIAALSLFGCDDKLAKQTSPTELPTANVEIAEAKSFQFQNETPVSGTVHAQFNAILSSKITGRVVRVLAREGDVVKKGQLLLEIDSSDLRAAQEEARTNLTAASSAIEESQRTLEMQRAASAAQISAAKAAIEQAKAARNAAKAKLDLVLAGPRQQEVDQARAALQEAQSNLKLAQTEFNRTRVLVESGALARRELDVAQNRLDQARAQVRTAQASLSVAREGSRIEEVRQAREVLAQTEASIVLTKSDLEAANANALQIRVRESNVREAYAQQSTAVAQVKSAGVNLTYSRIEAPFDGKVSSRAIDPGGLATPGTPLLVVEGGEYRLEASVPEKAVQSLKLGAHSKVIVDALSGTTFDSQLVEISPQGDESAHAFRAKYRLTPTNHIKSGMYGHALVAFGKRTALAIPEGSVVLCEGLTETFVVNGQGRAKMRVLVLGEKQNGLYEVLSGLASGEQIVATGASGLVDGQKVRR